MQNDEQQNGQTKEVHAMRRIVVSLLKGGVAKSETAVNLSHGLALAGYKVLLVDTDVQAQCSDMLGVDPDKGLADVIAGWGEPLENLFQARENLWLLAGGNDLAAVKMEIARREMAPEAVLDEALSSFEGRFDFMILDTAPGWDTLLVNALYCSREVLSPVSMEPMALSGLMRFEDRLSIIQKYNPLLHLRWVVPTFVDGRVKKSGEILSQLQATYGERVAPAIKYSVRLSEAPAFGQTIYEHDPKGVGAKSYQALTQRIMADGPAEQRKAGEVPDAAPAHKPKEVVYLRPIKENEDEKAAAESELVADLVEVRAVGGMAMGAAPQAGEEPPRSQPPAEPPAQPLPPPQMEFAVQSEDNAMEFRPESQEPVVEPQDSKPKRGPRIIGANLPRLKERLKQQAASGNQYADQALREIRERFEKHGGA
jgi:chromosome partitioning protein